MKNILIDILFTLPQVVICACFCLSHLEIRKVRLFAVLYPLVTLAAHIYFTYFFLVEVQRLYIIKGLVTTAIQYILILPFSKGPLVKRVTFISLMFVLLILSETLAVIFWQLAEAPLVLSAAEFTPTWIISSKISHLVIFSIAMFFYSKAWGHVVNKGDQNIKFLVALFPLSQLVMLSMIEGMAITMSKRTPNVIAVEVIVILVGVGADIGLLRLFHQMKEQHILKRRQAELEHRLEFQERYYQEITKAAGRISCLRHDINNQLQTISLLIERGETELAEKNLEGLADALRSVRGEPVKQEEKQIVEGSPV